MVRRNPNILFIMADNVSRFDLGAYNLGMAGYRTSNIDRIGREGAIFTNWYGQLSRTAGQAAFITGQSPIRTGLTKLGPSGAKLGLRSTDVSIAQVMRSFGYATGQFGGSSLGDRNEHLPTVHGFDEFFGNPSPPDPTDSEHDNIDNCGGLREGRSSRQLLICSATDEVDPTFDPIFGQIGQQVIRNGAALEGGKIGTAGRQFLGAAKTFIRRQQAKARPWFCLFSPTRTSCSARATVENYGDSTSRAHSMAAHDRDVGELLDLLDELGAADNCVVVYTTAHGAECVARTDVDVGNRAERNPINWESRFGVPCLIRWPELLKAGRIINEIGAHEDFVPTFAAAAGETDIVGKLRSGHSLSGVEFKLHLDGHDLTRLLAGRERRSSRPGFLYWSDEVGLIAARTRRYRIMFARQDGAVEMSEPWSPRRRQFTGLEAPDIQDMNAEETGSRAGYSDKIDRPINSRLPLAQARAFVGRMLDSFNEFPPCARRATFYVAEALKKIESAGTCRSARGPLGGKSRIPLGPVSQISQNGEGNLQ